MAETLINLRAVDTGVVLKQKVYEALREGIVNMDIYSGEQPLRLDERRLTAELGVSRTPLREAISRLEQEGLVRTIPHRGAFVVRKTKEEIIEKIQVWAALEGMAARLAAMAAGDGEIGKLRTMFATFDDTDTARARIDEYSGSNIEFHQAIIGLSGNKLLQSIADELFIHMRAIRSRAIRVHDRVTQSVIDHIQIIEALEHRRADEAERLVREHALNLAEHVRKHLSWD